MSDLKQLLDQIQQRAEQSLGDEPDPVGDGPAYYDMWIKHQRNCAEESQQDVRKLVAALRAVITDCRKTIKDARKYSLADMHLAGQGAQARATRDIITKALGADDE